jgi:hypothetical protein
VDAVDLWEHTAPSEVKLIDGKYKCIKKSLFIFNKKIDKVIE